MKTELSIENRVINFTQDQIDLIKSQIAPKATDTELELFLYQARRTGLDPLTRQIYAIHRSVKEGNNYKQKMTIQTSIDGFRVIAERSGDYAGQDEPMFVEEDGKLVSCKVTVYRFRENVRYPAAVGVAYWSEYNQETSPIWRKMPHTMLAKVAEALALRKAYPQDLSGLYTGDEMAQTTNEIVVNEQEDHPAQVFFKKNVEHEPDPEYIEKLEEERLNKLRKAIAELDSIEDIDKYLSAKFNGRTRMEALNQMSEVNAAEARSIIEMAKLNLKSLEETKKEIKE